jgi:hypothetical protein
MQICVNILADIGTSADLVNILADIGTSADVREYFG